MAASSRPRTVVGFEAIELAVPDVETAASSMETILGVASEVAPGGSTRARSFALQNVRLDLREVDSPGDGEGRIDRFTLRTESGRLEIGRRSLDARGLSEVDVLPALPPAKEATAHPEEPIDPAAVHALDHLVIRSQDVDATRAFYGSVLGLRVLFDREFPDFGARLCMCRVGDAVLEIAGSLGESVIAGKKKDSESAGPRDQLWGITWRVGDADAAWERLTALGVSLSSVRKGRRPGTRVFTVRDQTCGVPTLVIEPPGS